MTNEKNRSADKKFTGDQKRTGDDKGGESCPCGSGRAYGNCCEPLHRGTANAETAEAVMRARYCAFVKKEIDYLDRSYHPSTLSEFDAESARKWADESEWLGLEIRTTEGGTADNCTGKVEFVARYRMGEEEIPHHEIASFRKENGTWLFVDGRVFGGGPYTRSEPKTGRNEPCPCGSGKKFKKCCGK